MARPWLRLQQITQICGRILIGPSLRDSEAIDLADMLFEASTDVERPARLHGAHHGEHIAAGHRAQVPRAERRKGVALKSGEQPAGVPAIERFKPVLVPGTGSLFERHRRCRGLLRARIYPLRQRDLCLSAAQPRLSEA